MVTTPANTASSFPQSTNFLVGPGVVERIEVVVPAGHAGLTGIAFEWGGRQVVPYEGGEWLTGNDDKISVDLGLYVQATPLRVRTYNTDEAFEHSHHLRAYVVELGPPEPEPTVPFVVIPPTELEGGPAGAFVEWDDAVSAESEAFLLDLQAILDGFLLELRTVMGETPVLPEPELLPEPEPELGAEPAPAPAEERVQVPDVVGATRDRARDRLQRAGFTVNVELRVERGTAGVVVDQQPRGGAMRPRGFTVTITVRRNPR